MFWGEFRRWGLRDLLLRRSSMWPGSGHVAGFSGPVGYEPAVAQW